MPREDETRRLDRYGGHPPACTCVDCCRRRLGRIAVGTGGGGGNLGSGGGGGDDYDGTLSGAPGGREGRDASPVIILAIFFLIIAAVVVTSYFLTERPAYAPSQVPAPQAAATPSPRPKPAPAPPTALKTTPVSAKPPITQEQLVQHALQLINADRVNNSLPPVVLGTNKAAQKHAEDMLKHKYLSHWGTDGLKPYMRYTLAGGYNNEAENVSRTWVVREGRASTSMTRDPKTRLEEAEKGLMGSTGHRRNILNKWHIKLNLGIANDEESFTLVQQFEGDYITFSRLPVLDAKKLSLAGETIAGFSLEQIQVWYDRPPIPLAPAQLNKTYSYGYGKPLAFIRPPPPPGSYYLRSTSPYTWYTSIDPYTISPSAESPSTSTSSSARLTPLPLPVIDTVTWVGARRWEVSGKSFVIEADLSEMVSLFGNGVYTVSVWGTYAGESFSISDYSIFLK